MRILSSGVAAALLFGATVAHAAGLGKLTVNSALGQILNAEIELVSLQPGELESLTARVAAPEAFREARIEYTNSLRLLRFSVEKRPSGQPFLKITSVAPINEPFVDALIEVTWPAGRVQREYPILLDPPGFAEGKSVPATTTAAAPQTPPASAPAVASSSPAPAAVTSGTGAPSAQAELGRKPAAASEPKATGDTYGPVQKGENLRKIAEEVKPSSVSLEQMLVALYRENKGAFAGNNMNRLKTGQILKVPSAEEVDKIAKKDAGKEISTHVADWNAYRGQVASGAAGIPSRPESTNASSGRIASASVAPPPAPVADSNKDVLKVTKSDASGKGAAAGKGGDAARVAAMQEELTAKEKALKESQSRVTDLEKQIKDMQRLLDLKGATPGKADPKVAAVPAPTPAPAKVEPAKPAEPVKAPEPPKLAEAPKPAEPAKPAEPPKAADAPKAAEPPKPAEPPKVAEAPKAPPKAAPKKAPPPPKSLMDEVLEEPMYLAAGGAGILALGAGAFAFMRRRRAAAADEGPSSNMTSAFPSDLKPDSTTGKAGGGGLVDTGNSSFLTDFDKTGPGTIDTDEVDPVAEAEVYIAYGRDAQAEEILKEAMARDKNRHEISLKLLEIYHARKSATAFETVAKELRNAVGEQHPLWQKAAAMGAQIDPSNPLYGSAANGTATFTAMAPSAPAPKPDLDFDVMGGSSTPTASGEAAAPAPAMDFDLDLGNNDAKPAEEAAPAPAAGGGLDFDIAALDTQAVPAATGHAAEPAKDEKAAFDFDLSGLDFPTSKSAAAEPAHAAGEKPALDLTDLTLDTPPAAGGEGGEAVGTKLELAKAYLEIGDKDGAREILQEVAKEGSSAQKEEAQKLIASL